MATCDRCQVTTSATTGSYFNTQMICLDCADREAQHPDFERARRIEAAAVRRDDFNYPGVGLPSSLRRES